MKINTLGKILGAALMCAAFFARADAPTPPDVDVVPSANGTFTITKEAGTTFTRDAEGLKSKVQQEAAEYCASQGKVMKIISLSGKVPTFGLGYAHAKIVFKALNPGDPELYTGMVPVQGQAPVYYQVAASPQQPVYIAQPAPAPAPAPAAVKELSTDELVASLTKLDDLRKKGILSDEEFQAEKKKLLNHTN